MIGEILTGLNILEKLGKFWNWLRGRKRIAPAESVATRFIRLFESHDVHRNQGVIGVSLIYLFEGLSHRLASADS